MDDTGDASAGEVAYDNTADEASARQAIDLYRRSELQVKAFNTEGVVSAQIWGTCPRCGHQLNVQQTPASPCRLARGPRPTVGADRAGRSRDGPVPRPWRPRRGWAHAHPGAPEQVTGCGVSFRLPTPPPAPPHTS